MEIGTILLLVLIGLGAGVLSGLVGIGGGIVIVPALVLLLGFAQKTAQGTTLAMFVIPFSILGVLNYYQQGHVSFRTAVIMGLGFVVGSYFGSKLAVSLPEHHVRRVFAVMLLLVALRMLWGK